MAVFVPFVQNVTFFPYSKHHRPSNPGLESLSLLKYETSSANRSSVLRNCNSSESEQTHFKRLDLFDNCISFPDCTDIYSNKFRFLKNPTSVTDVPMINLMIRECSESGFYEDAIGIYLVMLNFGIRADELSRFSCLIKSFGGLRDLRAAKQIHGHVVKIGITKDVYISNSLLGMHWKCGAVEDALDMFDRMTEWDVVSWNIMISGFNKSMQPLMAIQFFCDMQYSDIKPNRVTCLAALSACASCRSSVHGQMIHALIVKIGLHFDVAMTSTIIDMYMKCGDCLTAELVFTGMPIRSNTVSWNAMISGYVYNGCSIKALILFCKMRALGIEPDLSTMVSILASCSQLSDLQVGKQVHGCLVAAGLQDDARVETALLDMYCKCSDIDAGLKLFKEYQNKNFVAWGAIIFGCARNYLPAKALELFTQFNFEGGRADSITILSALRACSSMALILSGMEIHGFSIKMGFDSDVFVGGALTDMYAKCGDIGSARKVLLRLQKRDVVAWNALISGYTQNGYIDNTLEAFQLMQFEHVVPNSVTIACILSVCAQLSTLVLCKQMHGYVVRNWLELNVLVTNSLIAAYARCGDISSALYLFQKMPERDETSWNSMISALGMHGRMNNVLVLFNEMKEAGMKPDHITFTCILSACSHTGRVNEGWQHFRSMNEDYGVLPTLEQYTCMVDLLGRAGHLDQAYDLIMNMPCEPDAYVWGSLLGSCKIHGNKWLAEQAANQIFQLDSRNAGYYVLLSNIYEDFGTWDDVTRIRMSMKDAGLEKRPGCSWIEVSNKIHVFLASDQSHTQLEEIYAVLEILTDEIKGEGYSPRLHSVSSGSEQASHRRDLP